MTACTEFIIPIQLDSFSISGVGQLLGEVKVLEKNVFVNVGHKVKLLGALVTIHEKGTKISKEVAGNIKQVFNEKLFKSRIPKNTKIKEAQNVAKVIFDYDPSSTSAKAYKSLIKEILER